jgi:hypothetical protein
MMAKKWTWSLVVFGILVGVGVGWIMSQTATSVAEAADKKKPARLGGPRYSVIETEGHNLIVTDNKSNVLFFYTIDKDKEVGSELKLRGTLDLNEVGKPKLKPERASK